ncbi:MAG: serine/threonine protein kinase [Labilithrix sp.]|nr:serine/threonine protein kinase [Labilithrix sp.]
MTTGRIGNRLLGGRYELIKVLGRGGQSTVYRARDHVDGDEVAIKVVTGAIGDPDATERMFREVQSMCQLQGTAAVRVLHQVRTDDGALGLVMELLEGRDLEAHLVELEERGERASLEFVEEVFGPIVSTLVEAHDRGLVHRDIKPENIFIVDASKGGGVRLLDFGFVKLLRAPRITGSETVAGSPYFMAPEMWLHGAAVADPRSDAYAIGAVLFRALAGKPPFSGALVEIMQAALEAERPSLHSLRPELSPDVDAWVKQALAVSPDERFQSVKATWRALLGCFPGR